MQLPPTILSLNKHGKKGKQAKSPEKPRKSGSDSKGTSTKLSKPDESKASWTDNKQEDVIDSSSETGSESETESIHGDVVIAEETTVPAADVPQNPSEPSKKRPPRHSGLRPPRTLETTLFDRLERMYGPGIKRLLNVQYRYAPIASPCVLVPLTTPEDARPNLPVSIEDALYVQAEIAHLSVLAFALRFAEYEIIYRDKGRRNHQRDPWQPYHLLRHRGVRVLRAIRRRRR